MNNLVSFFTAILVVLSPVSVLAEKQPETVKEKFSYAVGVQVAQTMQQQGFDIDIASVTQAITDILSNVEMRLTIEEMQQAMTAMQQEQLQKQTAIGKENQAAGEKFLFANKDKENVIELPSGLQYKIIRQGTGSKPGPTDEVIVHYRGTLLNGNEFDSSYSRGQPLTFSLDGVIKGWQEAVSMMPVGSKWQIYLPPSLAYGERGAGANIGPNSTLIFDIELLSIN